MSEEETLDIEQQLEKLLTEIQPNLQDVIKRSFTNVAIQQTKNGEQAKTDTLEDTSYFAKNTQVTLSRLELVKSPTFHMQSVSLDLKSMSLSLRCSLGEKVMLYVNVGLVLEDDAFSYINPGIEFIHDEVLVKLSWPSPQKSGGYEFTTTEQLAKHIDDLPLTAAISLPLYALLRQKLQHHLAKVLHQATSISDVVGCNPSMLEAFSSMVSGLAQSGNRIVDMILINMRRTLLQTCQEVLEIPSLHTTFMHKIGSISFIGKLETDTGWVKNLATINRINDVSVTRPDPMKTSFHVTLRIKDLQLGYDEYRIKAMGVSCGGRVAAAFSDNALRLACSVGLARWEPYAQLDELSVQHCGGMDVHVTGLGPLSGAAPLVGTWCRGAATAHALPVVADQLRRHLHTALADLPLWELLHGKRP
ncbi:unnamed protein product [Colias eurytheme]|nr:unnamed protein product [Colias eurytheme]